MTWRVPEHLADEQRAVEAEIRAAFAGVTREGGISWSEADVIDAYGTEEQRTAARAFDRESSWEDLIDDPLWVDDSASNFSFLDPIGFRFYIAPAMIRSVRRGWGTIDFQLDLSNTFNKRMVARLNADQARAIMRFARFMIAAGDAEGDELTRAEWQGVLDSWMKRSP